MLPDRRNALTPEALTMMDTIARTGSFAAAARELGKVPSALTYNVRQLEDALDVLLFDRRSRQATLTAAGQELLDEGRRLLEQIDAVANRVKRVATGWETQLAIAVDDVLSRATILDLCAAFYADATTIGVTATRSRAASAAASSPSRWRARRSRRVASSFARSAWPSSSASTVPASTSVRRRSRVPGPEPDESSGGRSA